MSAAILKSTSPVMTVTVAPTKRHEKGMQEGGGLMVTTRLAFQNPALGLDATDRRDRVDPRKLLDLINRIKSASGAETPILAHPKPVAKAG